MWYVDFAWKMRLNGEKISRGCAPDPLTPGQVRGVPEGGCRADVWALIRTMAFGANTSRKSRKTDGAFNEQEAKGGGGGV